MNNTLEYIFDKYHLQETNVIEIPDVGRDDIARLTCELDFKIGIEVGVQRGLYSEVICRENPQMKVYGVDPWKAYVTHPAEDHLKTTQNHSSQEMLEQFYEQTKKRLSQYPNYEIIREYSVDALKHFEDESLDFVYIDANHEYNFVISDIEGWSKKIKKGGILAGHDYYKVRNPGSLMHVKLAVDDYVREHNISPLIIWGANRNQPTSFRDKRRSWSWVI